MKTTWTDQKVRADYPARLAWRLNKLERVAEDARVALRTAECDALAGVEDSIKSLDADDFDPAAVIGESHA